MRFPGKARAVAKRLFRHRTINAGEPAARRWNDPGSEAVLAAKALDAIVSSDPKRSLDDATRTHIRAYAAERLGTTDHAPWLEVYTALFGRFEEGWITRSYFQQYVRRFAHGPHEGILLNTLAPRVLESDRFPDLGYLIRGHAFDANYKPITAAELERLAFDGRDAVVVKGVFGKRGMDVNVVQRDSFRNLVERVGTGVVQRRVEVHPELCAIGGDSAPTLRVVTVHDGGGARLAGAMLRSGRQGTTHIESKSQIRVGIDSETGCLMPTGMHSDWRLISEHPDTGVIFDGITVPEFDSVSEICVAHHDRLPHVLLIGWDVAVTSDGEVLFFEANAGGVGTDAIQGLVGPLFAGLGWDRLHLR